MNGSTTSAYAERFNKVFDHIDKHLDEELSVARLSQIANFSKFHFHRQFCAYAGIANPGLDRPANSPTTLNYSEIINVIYID